MNRSTKIILGLLATLLLHGVVTCTSRSSSDASDADGDADAAPARPEGIPLTTWAALQKTSPTGRLAPPTDPTNQYAGDPAAEKLGRYLFFETDISGNGEVSCARCHKPSKAFSARTPLAVQGVGGEAQPTKRHAPTLLNVAYNTWFFWNGRRDTLWSQAIVPFETPIEMGSSRLELAHYVYDHRDVRRAYESIFGALPKESSISPFPPEGRPVDSPQTAEQKRHQRAWKSMASDDRRRINRILVNVMKSIAAYEMRLVAVDAPFDRYVDQMRRHPNAPDKWAALDSSAHRGMKLFFGSAECTECHDGPLLGNEEFFDLDLPGRPWIEEKDYGRWSGVAQLQETPFRSTGRYSDAPGGARASLVRSTSQRSSQKGRFRTPTLRNVARTPPYMHGGHFETLDDVLTFYNELSETDPPTDVGDRANELDALSLSDDKLDDLKAFLESLSAPRLPAKLRRPPETPVHQP